MLTVFTNENSVYGEDHATDLMVDLISTDTWVLITVAVSNKELVVYYDGKLIGTMEAHAQPKDVGSTFDNYIGRSIFVNDPYLYADLSEFCLFNKALTAEQIATLYSLGK